VVIVLRDGGPLDVPPSDIRSDLGVLLDSGDGSDVSFIVNGEEFPAHRAVLAARSPIFKAQLLGSMADAKMASITLHDIAPAMFKVMLRFMYTDDLLQDEDEDDNDNDADSDEDDDDDHDDDELGLGGHATKKLQDLLAAADRYALDRLKLLCASKLWDNISVDTVASTLTCAEMYNCPDLQKRCIDFFADEKNFKKAVLTDDFAQLVLKFPSILAELRVKVRV